MYSLIPSLGKTLFPWPFGFCKSFCSSLIGVYHCYGLVYPSSPSWKNVFPVPVRSSQREPLLRLNWGNMHLQLGLLTRLRPGRSIKEQKSSWRPVMKYSWGLVYGFWCANAVRPSLLFILSPEKGLSCGRSVLLGEILSRRLIRQGFSLLFSWIHNQNLTLKFIATQRKR